MPLHDADIISKPGSQFYKYRLPCLRRSMQRNVASRGA